MVTTMEIKLMVKLRMVMVMVKNQIKMVVITKIKPVNQVLQP